MDSATKEVTVSDLIQELQNLPGEVPVNLKNVSGEIFLIAGFEAGSDGVTIIICEDDDSDDEE